MSPRAALHALALGWLAAAPALGADVTFGARSELWYDDNVLGTEDGRIEDGEVLISPTLGISERWGGVEAELNLKPTYELFFDQRDLRGFNYQADGSLAWAPSPRTRFELSDDFWRYRSLRLLSTAAIPGGTPAEFGARDRFTRNLTQLVASHRLTPIDTLQVAGTYALWDFSQARRSDQQSASAALSYQHMLSNSLALGASASYSRLSIDDVVGLAPERDTDYVNLSLLANYEPVDTFLVSLSAGPTWIRQPKLAEPPTTVPRSNLYRFSGNDILVGVVPSTCPTLSTGEFYDGPGCNFVGIDPLAQALAYVQLIQRALDPVPVTAMGGGRDEYTYFADLSVEKSWEAATLSVNYRRDEGSNSAANFSTVADTVELRAMLRPLEAFTLHGAVVWEKREETATSGQFVTVLDTVAGTPTQPAITNLVPVGVRQISRRFSQAVETISAYASASYRMTARSYLDAAVSWRDQNAEDLSFFNDYERFQVMIGVRVELEPLRW